MLDWNMLEMKVRWTSSNTEKLMAYSSLAEKDYYSQHVLDWLLENSRRLERD